MIGSHLDNASHTSLALTCRTLYSICFPEIPPLNKEEKTDLLISLERELPRHIFCHFCVALHRWHGHWISQDSPCVQGCNQLEEVEYWSHFFETDCRPIPYLEARLIMNRHFYGIEHGSPVQNLERLVDTTHVFNDVVYRGSQRARIIDDKLLVLSVKSLSHSRGDAVALEEYIEDWSYGSLSICPHLTFDKRFNAFEQVRIPELAQGRTDPGQFPPCRQVSASCIFCLTDCTVDVVWQGQGKGYGIYMAIYQQLGDCRSPFDWAWHTMTCGAEVNVLRSAHATEYRPGCVRDRWNKADGIDGESHGEFVQSGITSRRRCPVKSSPVQHSPPV